MLDEHKGKGKIQTGHCGAGVQRGRERNTRMTLRFLSKLLPAGSFLRIYLQEKEAWEASPQVCSGMTDL